MMRLSFRFPLLCVLIVLGVALACAAPTPAEDPLVGKWVWHSNQIVTFNSDHTCTSTANMTGKWQFLNNQEAQRKYSVIWSEGVYRDKLICHENMQSAELIGEGGRRFQVRRAKD